MRVVGPIVYYNFTKFHQNRKKNKKVLLIVHLMDVSSVKVPLTSCVKEQVNSAIAEFIMEEILQF